MSSEIVEKESYVKIENEDNNKNKEINDFSNNFNKCYKNLKDSQEKNNSNKRSNSTEDEEKNKLLNKSNKSKKKPNKSIIFNNSLAEFDLINFTNKNTSKRKIQSNRKSPLKLNNYLYLSSSSRDNLISFSNPMMVQTTTVQSAQIQNLKNKYLDPKSRKSELNSKSLKNLKKCSFSQNKFDSFLERVKESQKKKELHLHKIRCKSLENEKTETNVFPKINKKSLTLLKNSNRKPLYQKQPINEEPNIENNFQDFYAKTLKESQSCKIFEKSMKKNNNDENDKYNKFYEDKIKWKNKVEQKIKNRKLKINEQFEDYIDNFPFKPHLDKNSINIANKLNRQKSTQNLTNNNFFETGNDRGALNKFKAKLKPIISNFNNNHNYIPMINKKNRIIKRNLSEIILNNKKNNDKEKNKNKNKQINNKKKAKLNYKLNEKKYSNKKQIKDEDEINGKDSYLLKQLNKTQTKKNITNTKTDLYKLNIRPGTAWNQEVINKIKPLKECDQIIEGLL